MDGWSLDEQLENGWKEGRMDGWMVIGWETWKWMEGRMDGWMDGWMVIGWVIFKKKIGAFRKQNKICGLVIVHIEWFVVSSTGCTDACWSDWCTFIHSFIHSTVAQTHRLFFYNGKKATHLQPTRGRRRIPLDAGSIVNTKPNQTKPNQTKVGHTPLGTTNI